MLTEGAPSDPLARATSPIWLTPNRGGFGGRKENGLPRAFGPRNDIFRRLVLWNQNPGDGTQAVPYN